MTHLPPLWAFLMLLIGIGLMLGGFLSTGSAKAPSRRKKPDAPEDGASLPDVPETDKPSNLKPGTGPKPDEPENPYEGWVVFIDAGHTLTHDNRSPKFDDGSRLSETTTVRSIGEYLKITLLAEGIQVVETAPPAISPDSLRYRVDRANRYLEDHPEKRGLFVSLHTNAEHEQSRGGDKWGLGRGIEVFHFPGSKGSRLLAEMIAQALHKLTGFPLRSWSHDNTVVRDGVGRANFFVLRETHCEAVLIEYAFHTHLSEAEYLREVPNHPALAEATYEAISQYIDAENQEETGRKSA